MGRWEEYQMANYEATRAWLDKNFRLASDMYWKAIQLTPDGVWTKYRLFFLQCYVHCLHDNLIVPTKKDYKRLETHIVNNENEPNIFRVKAAFCLGLMYANDKKNYEEAAECFRQCIGLCDNASPEEKGRFEIVMGPGGTAQARQLIEIFDEVKANALKLLRQTESCGVEDAEVVEDPVRSPWCVYPLSLLVSIFGDIPAEQMERRLAAGGATCDCCGVARGSTDLKRLLACSKCKMAFYCSKECQAEQWTRRGHKKACRKPRKFHAEDVVRYFSEGSTTLMRLKLRFDGEDVDGSRKWLALRTTRQGGLCVDVVDESTLRHIRPADIV